MKKIKLNKKLQLNKETIAKLNNDQMNGVKGGASETCVTNCGTCATYCGTCVTCAGCETITACYTQCINTTAIPNCKAC